MKVTIKTTTIILIFITIISCNQEETNTEWKRIFDKHNITGTFVLKNTSTDELKIYNEKRSDSTYLPASTFKILNSMIALQTSAIESENDTIKWDGKDKGWIAWNKDQTMKTAMPVSCVWFYQELARRIGKDQMQNWINKANYGNKNTGKEIDSFWLEGDLRISAKEQILFIEKLVNNELLFDKQIQESVKEIMITDSTNNYIIHSKTGWTKQIGWNVGYIETNNNIWIFAMNQNITNKQEAKFRKKITYEVLRTEDIIK
ncbi:MAG: class D beta-lactamase [Bacteroidota bacterium]